MYFSFPEPNLRNWIDVWQLFWDLWCKNTNQVSKGECPCVWSTTPRNNNHQNKSLCHRRQKSPFWWHLSPLEFTLIPYNFGHNWKLKKKLVLVVQSWKVFVQEHLEIRVKTLKMWFLSTVQILKVQIFWRRLLSFVELPVSVCSVQTVSGRFFVDLLFDWQGFWHGMLSANCDLAHQSHSPILWRQTRDQRVTPWGWE